MTFELPARSRTAKLFIAPACALLIGGSAYAVTSANFTYEARQVGFVSVSSMALAPDNNDDVDYDNDGLNAIRPGIPLGLIAPDMSRYVALRRPDRAIAIVRRHRECRYSIAAGR